MTAHAHVRADGPLTMRFHPAGSVLLSDPAVRLTIHEVAVVLAAVRGRLPHTLRTTAATEVAGRVLDTVTQLGGPVAVELDHRGRTGDLDLPRPAPFPASSRRAA